jgi:selenocysteine lyase/cysteine desulfurase
MRGASWVTSDSYSVADSAKRYEDWEFPYALVLGQAEAARYAQQVGVEIAQARAWSLAESLRRGLERLPGIRILDRGRIRCALVTASIAGIHAGELVAALSRERINSVVSLREYGQLDFGDKGVSSAIRLSPHYYNSEEEISATIEAAAEFLRKRLG